uniref:KATNIP domain-containing protein n=1 Tax=Chromera velia CCMP2878 TaxID=1169474 RepID=A0A0G4H9M3_9ALVE|mmetsp:Transcript_31332/g.61870  ORF Transcript_31332/g.61870 Transcript_31332/m.61870 type:complete len:563 (-) Transcript_31332:486-2174(-)|eukprot:Cvel_25363.t1-p1 / transcript=Cvel_25363.t1 / gene=Cvel_25363 / organism=Chromera_velia_CCMP2878 / gene_product=hypothetical protein / transcript_product=hypothetical protein / location=Cvel_scaffold2863:5735-9769(-) / protein_length=562 / sequence_SO=supercontig / SO=protein_coding / is_pseudo=false
MFRRAAVQALLLGTVVSASLDVDKLTENLKLPPGLGAGKFNFSSLDFKLPDLFGDKGDALTTAKRSYLVNFPKECPSPYVPVLDPKDVACKGEEGGCTEDLCCRWWITPLPVLNDSFVTFGFFNLRPNFVGGWAVGIGEEAANFDIFFDWVGSVRRSFDFTTLFDPGVSQRSSRFDFTDAGQIAWMNATDDSGDPDQALLDLLVVLEAGDLVNGQPVVKVLDIRATNDGKCVFVNVETNTTSDSEFGGAIEKVTLPSMSRSSLIKAFDVVDGETIVNFVRSFQPSPNGENWLIGANAQQENLKAVIVEANGKGKTKGKGQSQASPQLLTLGGAVMREGDPVPPSLGLQIPGTLTWGTGFDGPNQFMDITNKGDKIVSVRVNNGTENFAVVFVNEEPVYQQTVTCFDFPNTNCDLFFNDDNDDSPQVRINEEGDWLFMFEVGSDSSFAVVNGEPLVGTGTDLDLDGDGVMDVGVKEVRDRGTMSQRFKDGTVDVYLALDLCDPGVFDCSGGDEASLIAFTVKVGEKGFGEKDVLEKKGGLLDLDLSSLNLKGLNGKFDFGKLG